MNDIRDVALAIEQGEHLALLVKGEDNRVNKLRALGNGLCIPLAAEVVRAYLETR